MWQWLEGAADGHKQGMDEQFAEVRAGQHSAERLETALLLLSTLLVAGLGIVFATILGFVIGISRLSKNWLLSIPGIPRRKLVPDIACGSATTATSPFRRRSMWRCWPRAMVSSGPDCRSPACGRTNSSVVAVLWCNASNAWPSEALK